MEIDIKDLYKLGFRRIIDIRNIYDYNLGSIPNSINIEKKLLLLNPNQYLLKNKKYYIYCDSGEISKKVVKELNELGYSVYNIKGGYNAYKNM